MNDLICGDCLDTLPDIPDASVDLILTDPPYSITNLDLDKDFDITRYLPEFRRVLKPGGRFFCFAGFGLGCAIFNDGWKYRFRHVWVKTKNPTYSANGKMPFHIYEDLYAFIKNDKAVAQLYFDKKSLRTRGTPYKRNTNVRKTQFRHQQGYNVTRRIANNEGWREGVDVVIYPNKTAMSKHEFTEHPTQKPLDLAKLLVNAYCPPDGLVLDPFVGSGTTALAAKMTGRRYIAVERDLKYYAMACHRLGMPVTPEYAKLLRPPEQTALEDAA